MSKKNEKDIKIQQAPCPDPIECDRTVTACAVVEIPEGFMVPEGAQANVLINPNLACQSELCTTTCTVPVSESCGGGGITQDVEISLVSLVGAISYLVNVPIAPPGPGSCASGEGSVSSCTNSINVDNLVCVAPSDFDCANVPELELCNVEVLAAIIIPIPDCNAVRVEIEFLLPNICEGTPA